MDMYKAMFENAPDPVFCVDAEGRILQANGEAERMFGYPSGEMLGMAIEALLPERFRQGHRRMRGSYMAAPRTRPMGSGRLLFAQRRDGTEFPVDVMLSTAETGNGQVAIAILRDITEKKELDRKVDELLAKLQLSSQAAGMGYWTYEEGSDRLWCDETFARLFGGTPADFPDGQSVRTRIHPEDVGDRQRRAWESLNAMGQYESEFRVSHPDGSVHWLGDLGRFTGGGEAQNRRFAGVTFDISARKHTEFLAHQARERQRELFEMAPDGIFLADLNGVYTDVNESGCRLLGMAREELLGKAIMDIIPPEDIHRLADARDKLLAGGTERSVWKLKRKDGTYVPVEVSSKIFPDGRWQAFVRDVTELQAARRKQDELIQSLQTALHEVKVLRGMLPICSHCKRIRDEGGRWEQMESFIRKRSEAEFSHGICPECMAEHYSEFAMDRGDTLGGGTP